MVCYIPFGPHTLSPQLFSNTLSLTIAISDTIQMHNPNPNRSLESRHNCGYGNPEPLGAGNTSTLESASAANPAFCLRAPRREILQRQHRRGGAFTAKPTKPTKPKVWDSLWASSHHPDPGHNYPVIRSIVTTQ